MPKKLDIKKRFACLCLVLACAGFIASCKPDLEVVEPETEESQAGARVTASVQGRVVFEKAPVAGATVTTPDGSMTTTDADGIFTLQNVQLNANSGFVKVEKEGFFTGSSTFLVNANSVHSVAIALIAKTVTGSFAASAGGKATAARGSVVFPAAAVGKADGSPYDGTVSVSTFYLDPTSPTAGETMPGELRGLNASGQERGIKSFGMMVVELNGANGEKLQVAAGKAATLSLSIPVSLQATAPATIPLWYFDEQKGTWQEQGTATRQGSAYVGTASHFTYWTTGLPFQAVNLQAVIKNAAGQVMSNVPVVLSWVEDSTTFSYSPRTDANGRINTSIGANRTYTLEVDPYACYQDVPFTRQIGPFTANTNLGEVVTTINQNAKNRVVITGKIEKCDGTPLTNGYVRVSMNGSDAQCVTLNGDGSYETVVYLCPNPSLEGRITVQAIEKSLEKNNLYASVYVPANQAAYNAGTMRVRCTPEDGFMTLTVGEGTYSIVESPNDLTLGSYVSNGQQRSKLFGYAGSYCPEQERYMYFELITAGKIDSVGTYTVLPSKVDVGASPAAGTGGITATRYTFSGGELTITALDDMNGYYVATGSYSGTATRVGSTTEVPFSCTFRSVRKQ